MIIVIASRQQERGGDCIRAAGPWVRRAQKKTVVEGCQAGRVPTSTPKRGRHVQADQAEGVPADTRDNHPHKMGETAVSLSRRPWTSHRSGLACERLKWTSSVDIVR